MKELTWARTVLDTFERAGGDATKLPDGEFIDLPVAERARSLLDYRTGFLRPCAVERPLRWAQLVGNSSSRPENSGVMMREWGYTR